MGKCLHKLFKAVVNEIFQFLPILVESGSEISYFIPSPRKISKVTRLSEYIKKPWLRESLKYLNNLINNQNFQVQYPEKGEPVTKCIDFYKEKCSLMEVLTS